jgi:hypothetical protein
VSLVFLYLFFEETNWNRDLASSEAGIPVRPSVEVTEGMEKSNPTQNGLQKPAGDLDLASVEASDTPTETFARKSFWEKLKLIDLANAGTVGSKTMMGLVIRPILYVRLPVVVFCGISVGCYQMWLSFLNGTESSVMTSSYGFSTEMLGVPFVSPIIFAVLG